MAAEYDKVIYNKRVTKVAISENWLVTCECYDDQERSIQINLKFWQFNEQKQNYSLNTNVLSPHEQDLTALELSTAHQAETVYCASAAGDRVLKLWSNGREVYGKGNVWHCVGQRGYKDLPVNSVCFSKDGSVLIAGFGRHVVIFKGNNLRDIRCVLTAPTGLDGAVNRVGVLVPKGGKMAVTKKGKKQENNSLTAEEANDLVTKYLKTEDGKEKTELRKRIFGNSESDEKRKVNPLSELPEKQEAQVFEKIVDSMDMDLEQKLKTLNGLGLEWGVDDAYKEQREEMYEKYRASDGKVEEAKEILGNVKNLKHLRNAFGKMAIAKELQATEVASRARLLPPISGQTEYSQKFHVLRSTLAKHCPEISTVVLGVGEYSHLLIVTTRNRVLIWNLLTLKIQTVLKLSCQHICMDPISGYLAAFTRSGQCE